MTAQEKHVDDRLKYFRKQIMREQMSYGDIAELQGLVEYIHPDDVLLLQWAGVPEVDNHKEMNLNIKYIKVEFDDCGDTQWQWYVEVYDGKRLVWDDYYQEKPSKADVLYSIREMTR